MLESHAEEGLTFETMWQGPGLPFAGSLIMLLVDIVLYMTLAFYLDNVLPSNQFQVDLMMKKCFESN